LNAIPLVGIVIKEFVGTLLNGILGEWIVLIENVSELDNSYR